MLDFLMCSVRSTKKGTEVYPKFKIVASSDLMIRGGDFYAVWDEAKKRWSTSEQDLIRLIDKELTDTAKRYEDEHGEKPHILYMWDADTGSIDRWHKYCQRQTRDSFHSLDDKLMFSNMEMRKEDYASKCLSYPLEDGKCEAWEQIISTLYTPSERHKIEWAIGSIVNGDSRYLQKFLVLYGAMGTGKSTILNIIQMLFDGYYAVFEAKTLGSANNAFALEAFRSNPLVAIDHDGDLSRIEDNTRLNSLVSHENMTVNEKFKSTYSNAFKSFLFLGTNKPVKITDSKSGLLRRLIDVEPSGNKLPVREYNRLMKQIPFELGAIAWHCKEVYEEDPEYYDDYVPVRMMGATNDFFNFLIDSYPVFKRDDSTTLKAAWAMYKEWVEDAKVSYPYPMRVFKEELKDYFREFEEVFDDGDGGKVRCRYSRFKTEKFKDQIPDVRVKKKEVVSTIQSWIDFKEQPSLFDSECANCPAQYADGDEKPSTKWANVKTTLRDLDTSRVHYVKVPESHIVIDFDIPDENGNKSYERNLEAASKWPKTYCEVSKSGAGIHLHYIYNGDVTKLSRIYDDYIEVKVFTGLSSLRRKLTKCNDVPIATISSGLPLKGEKAMVNFEGVRNEKALRTLIKRNLAKEIHADTTSSVNFIAKILDDAYNSDLKYDVSDLQGAVTAFAANSTNQAEKCLAQVAKMHFRSEEASENKDIEAPMVFFDCEVFPNLFLVCWKLAGEDKPIIRMINPKPSEIEDLLRYRLVGFNNRDYDNHMLYACLMGYTTEQIYKLSQSIIEKKTGKFREAYNLSYTDIYDFSSKKQSLKKFEIELGIHHQELGLPWDEPVPEELWTKVAEYCDNDVIATEAVFNARHGDFTARQILAELAGGTVNDTTNTLTTKFIFGNNRKPNLVYTDLTTGEQVGVIPTNLPINAFPGYEFKFGEDGKPHNMFRGEDVGFGGYVFGQEGMYGRTVVLDVSGMHPASIRAMNCFGDYTERFGEIVDLRTAIKHKDFDKARRMLDGAVAKYLDDEKMAKALAGALKIAVNSVYGLTSAKFDNPFRDTRNKNNIVALRGALFMVTLRDEVQNRGCEVISIKTDSIKLVNPTDEIIEFVKDFGKMYGYNFEIENIFDRICLVNKSTFIAHCADDDPETPGQWLAKADQFQVPYVFKTLFSKEPIEFNDMCEVLSVKTALYLRDGDANDPEFVGRVGQFCPIKPGHGGKELLRLSKDAEGNVKYGAATGTKGYFWLESEVVRMLGKEDDIDHSYYDDMVTKAVETISQYGDFEQFVDLDHPFVTQGEDELQTDPPCKTDKYDSCLDCPLFHTRELEVGPDICEDGWDVHNVLPF